MVLELIFSFLTGFALFILIADLMKNYRAKMPLVDRDVILVSLLAITLFFLALEQYIVALISFILSAVFLFLSKPKDDLLLQTEDDSLMQVRRFVSKDEDVSDAGSKFDYPLEDNIRSNGITKKKEIKNKPGKR